MMAMAVRGGGDGGSVDGGMGSGCLLMVMKVGVAMMVLMAVGRVMMLAMGVSCVLQDVKQHSWPLPAGAGSIYGSNNQNISRHHQTSPGAELQTDTNSALMY